MMYRNLFLLFFFNLTIFSCQENYLDREKQILIKTDIEFSNMSEKTGMEKAFLKYADDEAVLLRTHSMPIVGKEKIGKRYTDSDDTGFTLSWKPLYADVSKSKDLAYTYGTYTLSIKSDKSETYGTYLSIWKKQADGSWKWVLDTGNEGLE